MGKVNLAALLGALVMLLSCMENRREQADGSVTANLKDSITVFDSLATINRFKNKDLALFNAKKALKLAMSSGSPELLARSYTTLGDYYVTFLPDTAWFYYSKALGISDSNNFLVMKASLLYNQAMLQYSSYNYKKTLVLLDSAKKIGELTRDFTIISNVYNSLGNLYLDIHEPELAKSSFKSSFDIASKHQLNRQAGTALGNVARMESQPAISISLNRQALGLLSKARNTEEERAYIMINMGNRFSNPDSSIRYYLLAIQLAHSGHLPLIELGAYNNLAYSYLDKHDVENADICLSVNAIPLAEKLKNYDWLATLYDSYADVLLERKDFQNAVLYQKKANKTRVTADNLKAGNQVRLLSQELEVKSKELLLRNQEIELNENKNHVQQLYLWLGISFLVIVLSIVIAIWFRQRTLNKFRAEQISSAKRLIEMEENEKQRTSRELHDVIGQLMMGISSNISGMDIPEAGLKSQFLTRMDTLTSSIRAISHRMSRDYIERSELFQLLVSLCNEVGKITGLNIVHDIPEEEPKISNDVRLHIYRILQEILTNASKYAPKSNILVRVKSSDTHIFINYSDDGPGFNADNLKNPGIGLVNIRERVKLTGGKATLETFPQCGVSWDISIPIN